MVNTLTSTGFFLLLRLVIPARWIYYANITTASHYIGLVCRCVYFDLFRVLHCSVRAGMKCLNDYCFCSFFFIVFLFHIEAKPKCACFSFID